MKLTNSKGYHGFNFIDNVTAAWSVNYTKENQTPRSLMARICGDNVDVHIKSGSVEYGDVKICTVSPEDAIRLGKAMQEYGQKLVDEQFNTPISKEEFDNLQVGDKVVLVKNLKYGFMKTPSQGVPGAEVFVNEDMEKYAANETVLTVYHKRGTSANLEAGTCYLYTQEMIRKVTSKAPVRHYNVSFNMGEMWYAGSGGAVSHNRENAAKMNRQHAEAVSKKYGGVIVEVK